MRTKGKITSWYDERGFGFISPLTGGDRTFVHIRSFANRARRPEVGDVVTYSLSTDTRGRPCAEEATIAGVPKAPKPRQSSGNLPHVLASGFLVFVGGAVLVSAIPVSILLVYLLVSFATFAVYAGDKFAAEKGKWRTSESTLHLLALVGGWPGALIAQSRLRHKTKKQPFRTVFGTTIVLNCAALAWLFTPEGQNVWRFLTAAVV